MRQISRVLGVSRSNLSEQVKDKSQKLPATFSNSSDGEHLRQIKTVVDKRPTDGYRRVTAHVNLALKTLGNKPVNHKRIYRIMKANKLLLQRFTARPNRTHDGKVITLHSNTRWCSDSFSIQCYNGDRVHVVFSLDTCDREIISYLSSTIGIDGSMVRDLMLESVEKRFNASDRLSSPVQWLSDNGPCYIAHETVNFGRQLGFEICTTPSYSPESNGMAEAFVKTFKRDYCWFGDLSDAEAVMAQLPKWFDDYNECAPHKGLNMLSPRQFRRQQQAN